MTEREWLTSDDPAAMLAGISGVMTPLWHEVASVTPGGVPRGFPASVRKLRLFACACCRSVWNEVWRCVKCGPLSVDETYEAESGGRGHTGCWKRVELVGGLRDPRSRDAVEVAERFADGEATEGERGAAWVGASGDGDIGGLLLGPPGSVEWYAAMLARDCLGSFGPDRVWDHQLLNRLVPPAAQVAMLRDLFGNPFWPVTLPPGPSRTCSCEMYGRNGWVVNAAGKWQKCGDCHGTDKVVGPCPWLTPAVLGVARSIYDDRRFGDLPVLADALEDAGCAEEGLLRHLRGEEREVCRRCVGDGKAHGSDRPFEWSADVTYGKCVVCKGTGMGASWRPLRGPHARGCWALDLILGKE